MTDHPVTTAPVVTEEFDHEDPSRPLDELNLISVSDFAARAARVMPRRTYDYARDADGSATFDRGRYLLDSIGLVPRYLVDVEEVEIATTVLGQPIELPVLAAPSIPQSAFHPDGELATYRAAAAAGTVAVLGQASGFALADVAAAAEGPLWCEVRMHADKSALRDYVQQAEALGCTAVCLSVDYPVPDLFDGTILRDPEPAVFDVAGWGRPNVPAGSTYGSAVASFEDIEWLRESTSLPVVVRGILRGDDARECVEHGASAIVVSNHWANVVDSVVPAIEALTEVLDVVGDECEVLVEGGIRRGVDVLKAVALGARAVLIGRPVWWGLSVAGEQGVAKVFDILRAELHYGMTMCGATTIDELTCDLLVKVPTLFDTHVLSSEWYGGSAK